MGTTMNIFYLVLSAVLGGIINFLLKFVEPKSRFVVWLSHKYEYNIPLPDGKKVPVYVQTLRIDNLGRFQITDVEIVHKTNPEHFAFDPPQPYEESSLKSGEHLISIKSIAPHTGFSMQFFCVLAYPHLIYIRSKQGNADVVQVIPRFIRPPWMETGLIVAVIVGFATFIYWLIQLGIYVVHFLFVK